MLSSMLLDGARTEEDPHLPDGRLVRVLVGPHRLATLKFAAELQVHDAAAVAGINDAVQPAPWRQRVHQYCIQLVVDDLPILQQ